MENETRLKPHEQKGQREVEDEGKQERQPPANISGRVRGSNRHETTNVDE